MTMGVAVILLLVSVIGIVLICKLPRKNHRVLRIGCVILLSLLSLACIVYIGLTVIFVDAIQHQPIAP